MARRIDTHTKPMTMRRSQRLGCVAEATIRDISVSARAWTRAGAPAPQSLSWLHTGRHRDAHDCQGANQFAANDGDGGQQKLFSLLIRLAQDGMAMIERVEQLRQLEGVLGQVGRLCGGDALV